MPNIKKILQKAQIMIGEKKLIEANSYLDNVLLQEPNNAYAYNLKGIILGIDNKHKEAINFFKKSLNENPSDPLVIYNLA